MKILYGVQGTGNGHVARARLMAEALQDRGVDVTWLFSGRAAEDFRAMAPFGAWEWRRGLTFVHRDGAVDNLATWRANSWSSLRTEIAELDVGGFDLVVSDFEPVTAWAARRAGVRSIGLSNQAAYAHAIPRFCADPVQSAVFRWFAPVDIALGMHWDRFGLPLLPPIVAPPKAGRVEDDLVVAYLPFEPLNEVLQCLRAVHGVRFVCYHPQGPERPTHAAPHIVVRGLSATDFPRDLARCGGVIANAGFSLASEAVALGRRLLVKPLAGQFEQETNARTLEILGMGRHLATLDPQAVSAWLATPRPAPSPWPEASGIVADWLAQGAHAPVEGLCDAAWQATGTRRLAA